MKKGLTELAFILDRSGSMAGLESDTIGGYNALIERQRKEPGQCRITTVLFDDRYELLHDRVSIDRVAPLTHADYYVRGCTALLDAIGRTIFTMGNAQKYARESERAEKVMIVITTDGMENASREYTAQRVKDMIERQKRRFAWEFLFLGANIDALSTAARMGITPDRAANFNADSEGIRTNFESVSSAVARFRSNNGLTPDWKEEIDRDYARRGRKGGSSR